MATVAATIVGLLYLILGCIVNDNVPLAQATATCNKSKYPKNGGLGKARDELFTELVSNTFGKQNNRYCTWRGTQISYMYGMANCDMSSPSCNGNYCSTTKEQCESCLGSARKILEGMCGSSLSGQVTTHKEKIRCFLQYKNAILC
ncbi:hypothetical protein LINGRAHAP2_LOCUS8334 [Linum grandiflorum]